MRFLDRRPGTTPLKKNVEQSAPRHSVKGYQAGTRLGPQSNGRYRRRAIKAAEVLFVVSDGCRFLLCEGCEGEPRKSLADNKLRRKIVAPLLSLDFVWKNLEWKRLTRFIQTLDDIVHEDLKRLAKHRGLSVQQLIRAVIIPEWLKDSQRQMRPARETWLYPRLSFKRPLEGSNEPEKR